MMTSIHGAATIGPPPGIAAPPAGAPESGGFAQLLDSMADPDASQASAPQARASGEAAGAHDTTGADTGASAAQRSTPAPSSPAAVPSGGNAGTTASEKTKPKARDGNGTATADDAAATDPNRSDRDAALPGVAITVTAPVDPAITPVPATSASSPDAPADAGSTSTGQAASTMPTTAADLSAALSRAASGAGAPPAAEAQASLAAGGADAPIGGASSKTLVDPLQVDPTHAAPAAGAQTPALALASLRALQQAAAKTAPDSEQAVTAETLQQGSSANATVPGGGAGSVGAIVAAETANAGGANSFAPSLSTSAASEGQGGGPAEIPAAASLAPSAPAAAASAAFAAQASSRDQQGGLLAGTAATSGESAGASSLQRPRPFATVAALEAAPARVSFAAALAGAFKTPASPTTLPAESDSATIAPQFVQAIQLQWLRGAGEARVQLEPAYLGALTVILRVEQGAVSASIHADSPAVRAWLSANEGLLRQGLADQGLRLDRLEIKEPAADERPGDRQADGQQAPRDRRQPRRAPPSGAASAFEVLV